MFSIQSRVSALALSTMAGALMGVVGNLLWIFVNGNVHATLYGFDLYSGFVTGGLLALTSAMLVVETGAGNRMISSVLCAIAWGIAVHLVNVLLGWTSHGVTVTSIVTGIVFNGVIGFLCFAALSSRKVPSADFSSRKQVVDTALILGTFVTLALVLFFEGANLLDNNRVFGEPVNGILWCLAYGAGFTVAAMPKRRVGYSCGLTGGVSMLYLYGLGITMLAQFGAGRFDLFAAALCLGCGVAFSVVASVLSPGPARAVAHQDCGCSWH